MGKTDDSGGGGGGMLRRESLGHEFEGKEGENIYSFREKQKKGGGIFQCGWCHRAPVEPEYFSSRVPGRSFVYGGYFTVEPR